MSTQDSQELVRYGVDESNGTDSTGLTIVKGEKMWGYIGEEADVLLELVNQQVLQALEEVKSKQFEWKLDKNNNYKWVEVSAIDQVATKYRGGE